MNSTQQVTSAEYGSSVSLWRMLPMSPILFAIMLISITILGWNFSSQKRDPRQPPVLSPRIPFVGHLIGMIKYQGDYLKSLSAKHPSWSMFTLEIFSSKIYVATSPDIMRALFANTKQLSFYIFQAAFTERVLKLSKNCLDIMTANDFDNNYMQAIHNGMIATLIPGPDLAETSRRTMNSLALDLDTIGDSGQPKKLLEWLKNSFAIALSEGFYGHDNPIKNNQDLIPLIWDFESGIAMLFLNIFPSITARKALKALDLMASAFEEYYAKGLDNNANGLVKTCLEARRTAGFTEKEIAKIELTAIFAGLTNTVPNTFAMLCFILSDPGLTSEVVEEISGIVTQSVVDGATQLSLDTTLISSRCPVISSAWQESLRLCVNITSVRSVVDDFVVKDTYMLKKGAIIQMVGGGLHESERIWGPDVAKFNGRRFMKKPGQSREEKKAHSQGLLPFGGGKHLCPGRHFAFTETVSYVAMVLYAFDIRMKDGSGVMKMPRFRRQQFSENSRNPAHDIEIFIKRKNQFKDVKLMFNVDGTTTEVAH